MAQGRVRRAGAVLTATGAAVMLLGGGARAQLATINGAGSVNGINGGFGNVIGSGATLDVAQAAPGSSLINFTLTKGPGGLNDAAVFYIATGNTPLAGFNSTSTFTDTVDGGRRALSGVGTGGQRSTVNFATGFTADFGISVEAAFAGVFGLVGGGSHAFVNSANLSPTGTNTSPTYAWQIDLSDLGLAPGQSFDFVATYLNQGNAFRSNEFIGVAAGNFAADNIGANTASLAANSFIRFNSQATPAVVPEPGALALLAFGAGPAVAALRLRSRRRAR